ncbi:MAG: hypothetical protein V4726_18605 [Verrucomicrobiota bacterium]
MRALPIFLSLPLLFLVSAISPAAEPVAALLAVGPEGKGNADASAAWKQMVSTATPAQWPDILAAMDKANVLSQNWLRGAVYALADREKSAGRPFPLEGLTAFLKNTSHGGAGRMTAADLVKQADPAAWAGLMPGFLEDPEAMLRREPVAALLTKATAAKDRDGLRKALHAARDQDQVRAATDELRGLGETVDLPRHYGFLLDWKVIGPFDNKGRKGFDTVFPPEKGVDLAASYPGREADAKPVKWLPFTGGDEFGVIDFNKPLGMTKEVTAYAVTTYQSPAARDAEIRIGCKNAWKVWLNGEFIFGRDEYHRGMKIDQYILPVKLKAGPNEILVKCCQNEQTETWTVEWEYQLRICDASGTALLAPDRPPTPETALKGKM